MALGRETVSGSARVQAISTSLALICRQVEATLNWLLSIQSRVMGASQSGLSLPKL